MLKTINPRNIILTPIKTAKTWNLHNVDNSDLILLDGYDDTSIALEYVDYMNYTGTGDYPINADCSIALEQQSQDYVNFQMGRSGSGHFNENTDLKNLDGTYTRLVYSQIRNTFYNSTNNPVNTFGMENIDFGLSNTNRHIDEDFLLMNIPQSIFGNTLLPNSVAMNKFSTDDDVVVYDDGYGNMKVGNNIFYKIQEVRHFENVITVGGGDVNTYPPISLVGQYVYASVSPATGPFYGQDEFGILNTTYDPITISNITITGGASLSVAGGFPFTLSTPYSQNSVVFTGLSPDQPGTISIYAVGYSLPFILNFTA